MSEPVDQYDLLVVGGGIQGAWVALEAARAGQSVLLVEKGDFGSGTSANSLKVLHGGLRYLQHGNLKRIRESRRSVRALRAVAGDFIADIPFVLETKGKGVRGVWAMRVALGIFGILCRVWSDGGTMANGRVKRCDPSREVPAVRFSDDATGIATWNEAVMRNSDRVVFETIRAACRAGASCLNYVEATQLKREKRNLWKVALRDLKSDREWEAVAGCCVEATGTKVEDRMSESERLAVLRGVNLVFDGNPFGRRAVGLESLDPSKDPDALIRHGNRLLFFVPRGEQTMVGTWYDRIDLTNTTVSEDDVDQWLSEIEEVAPQAGFNRQTLAYVHAGLLPADSRPSGGDQPAKESEVYLRESDHVLVRTVKYTTAPEIAREVLQKLECKLAPRLVHREFEEVPDWERLLFAEDTIEPSELASACKAEMVYRLSDVLFRRTNVALDQKLSKSSLIRAADRLDTILDWDTDRKKREIEEVNRHLWRSEPEENAVE
ncbi:MAG: FAD-dependent oxidoreductase [Verrucomicrobiota bacterium]